MYGLVRILLTERKKARPDSIFSVFLLRLLKLINFMQNHLPSFIFVGRSGSGKGTQAELLIKALKDASPSRDSLYIVTGGELRELAKQSSLTASIIKNVTESGGLMPSFVPIYIWTKVMSDRYTGQEYLVFDGTPRKVLEARALDDLFPFYGLGKPWVIYLDVHEDESMKRLKLRGRKDDAHEAIVKRFAWYEADVSPVVSYYRTNPNVNFIDVNGVDTIEAVHADIVKKTGLK